MAIKPVNELTPSDIARMRQQLLDDAEQAVKWMPDLSGKVSIRVGSAIRRAYREGHLTKPIKEHTDKELLRVRGIGGISLEQIRKALRAK